MIIPRAAAFCLLVLVSVSTASQRAAADVALSGSFVAGQDCPAFQSFRKSTNPGNAQVESGRSYRLLAKNAEVASHYRIEVPGAVPAERWVSSDCGTVDSGEKTPVAPGEPRATRPAPAALILSLSWEPGFCATMPSKAECIAETAASFDASHFSLHGLWPQPRGTQYCNVDRKLVDADKRHDWSALPEVTLDADLRQQLDRAMPGTQSLLERHEWTRHGTCYFGSDAASYFREAISLVDQVNASAVQALFASRVGNEVTAEEVRNAFDSAFGAGTGERVKLSCTRSGSRRLLTEITVGLSGRPQSGKTLGDLVRDAGQTDPGCPSGLVAASPARP